MESLSIRICYNFIPEHITYEYKSMSFATRLQQIVHFSGLSQTAFADAIGIKQPSMSRYLKGTMQPGSAILAKIANLGFNVDWLLTGRGSLLISSETSQLSPELLKKSQHFATTLSALSEPDQEDLLELADFVAVQRRRSK